MQYEFKQTLPYAKGGEKVEGLFLEITAPTNKVMQQISKLDEQLHRALLSFSGKEIEADTGKKEFTGDDLYMLLASGNADLEQCFLALRKILVMTAKVDGEVKFTDHMFHEMYYADTRALLGEYVKFFLASSLLDSKKTEST